MVLSDAHILHTSSCDTLVYSAYMAAYDEDLYSDVIHNLPYLLTSLAPLGEGVLFAVEE